MTIKQPYFMSNEDWWTRDEEKDIIVLSKNAPKTQKIINSYRDYLRQHNVAKMARGNLKMEFNVDDEKQFEKFMNNMTDKQNH